MKDRWTKPRELTKDDERNFKFLSALRMNGCATLLELWELERLHRRLVLLACCDAEEQAARLERSADVRVN